MIEFTTPEASGQTVTTNVASVDVGGIVNSVWYTVSGVKLSVNGVTNSAAGTASWTYSAVLTEGTNLLAAWAETGGGPLSDVRQLTVIVDRTGRFDSSWFDTSRFGE